MDDAIGVNRAKRAEDVGDDRQRLVDAHWSALEYLAERFALEELHRDEQRAAVFADFVDLADVRMVDAGRRPRLAPEAAPRGLVVGDRQHGLHGDRPLQALVAGLVNHAHAAFAELAADFVMTD